MLINFTIGICSKKNEMGEWVLKNPVWKSVDGKSVKKDLGETHTNETKAKSNLLL